MGIMPFELSVHRCGNDTDMEAGWCRDGSQRSFGGGQGERVSRGRGGDLLVMNISCLTVTGDAGTLAQSAWRTGGHRSSAALFPFPVWQPGLLEVTLRRSGELLCP